ncbi:MAG: ATP-binding cassette domain-containing protein [Nitrososphaera sp.]
MTVSAKKDSTYNTNNNTNNSRINDNSITTSKLSKTFENFKAVDSLTIKVDSGDIFGFLGPNGAGKTTTIRMLCGLLLPSSGSGKVGGYDIIKDSAKIRHIIGLLPESSGFYGWMNAEEYLTHFALLYKIDSDVARKRTKDLLEKMGLAEKAFAPISYYSRGMKQRLGLARTLINEPQIIFLDEPTLGLDPRGQVEIREVLLELNREKGVTIVLSSHALGEVSSLCNKIAIIDHGQLIAQGDIDELRMQAGLVQKIVIGVANHPQAKQCIANLPFPADIETDNGNDLINIIIHNLSSNFAGGNNDNVNDYDCGINKILSHLMNQGLQIHDVQRPETNLEEIFFKLIGSSQNSNNNDAGLNLAEKRTGEAKKRELQQH